MAKFELDTSGLTNWLNYNQYWYRSLVVWLVSLLLLFILMLIPVKKLISSTQQSLLVIELDNGNIIASAKNTATEVHDELKSTSATSTKSTAQKKPLVDVPLKEKPLRSLDENVKLTKNTSDLKEQPNIELTTKIEASLPNSSEIINSAFNDRKNFNVGMDFQMKPKNINDFINKKVTDPEWNTATTWIDEGVDKPRVAMRFYPPGIAGSTERFFDKIMIKKTFKTKYGTKIQCVLIGLIAACGWK